MYELEKVISLSNSNFKFINSLQDGSTPINIYKYSHSKDCVKYFRVDSNIKMIGYLLGTTFYCVSLVKNSPVIIINSIKKTINEFKRKYNYTSGKNTNMVSEIMQKFQSIPDFQFISFIDDNATTPCQVEVDLANAKKEIKNINAILGDNSMYTLELDYVYNIPKDNEVNTLYLTGPELILCINKQNVCISSITMNINSKGEVYINSKTKQNFEGFGLNKILRSLVIILSTHIFPAAKTVVSDSVNPVSAWIMIKHLKGYPISDESLKTYRDIDEFIRGGEDLEVKVDINKENIENAFSVFNNTLAEAQGKIIPAKTTSTPTAKVEKVPKNGEVKVKCKNGEVKVKCKNGEVKVKCNS